MSEKQDKSVKDEIRPIHVSLVATPEVDVSALAGLHGTFNSFSHLVPESGLFLTDVVLPDSLFVNNDNSLIQNVMGMTIPVQKKISQVDHTHVLIIPSLYIFNNSWEPNPYPDLTDWILKMHSQGTLVCSSCTGAFLLAETGLLNGHEVTQHWAFDRLFSDCFPAIMQKLDKVLITTGEANRIVMTGAAAAWHDLVLYLISRYTSREAASIIAKFFLLNCHSEGQTPYMMFQENMQHDDAVILAAQQWLHEHSDEASPIEKVLSESGILPRTFNRRFLKATGFKPIHYVQKLKIGKARQLLETTNQTIDDISYQVGYEDPASFRRVFKRLSNMTPKVYRRRFQIT